MTAPRTHDTPFQHQSRRSAIRRAILAQVFGAIQTKVFTEGGVFALLILALGGAELAVSLIFTAFYGMQVVRVLAAPRVDVTSPRRFLLRGLGSPQE